MSELKHDDLSKLAAKWLLRPESSKGPNCKIAMTEVGGLFGGERADAWGYRWEYRAGSVLVEAKVSRADFLSDFKKPHRSGEVLGMGRFRYYICPEGLISIDELPEKWGLLYVNSSGHIKPQCGHISADGRHISQEDSYDNWGHEVNIEIEMDLMAHLLKRFGDVDSLNEKFRTLSSQNNSLGAQLQNQREKIKALSSEIRQLKFRLKNCEVEDHE